MLHNEHLRLACESYEIKHDNNGNALHVYIDQYQNAYIFTCLDSLVKYVYFGNDAWIAQTKVSKLSRIYELETYIPNELVTLALDKGLINVYNEKELDGLTKGMVKS